MTLIELGNTIRDTVKTQLTKQHVPNMDFNKVFDKAFGFSLGAFKAFLLDVRDDLNPQIAPEKWKIAPGFANSYLDKTVAELVNAIYHAIVDPIPSKVKMDQRRR